MSYYYRFILFIHFLCVLGSSASAQHGRELKTWALGASGAYQHQQVSMLKLGLWGLRDIGYANYLRLDAGVDLAFHEQEVHYIPELGVAYYLSAKGVWPAIKAELTPYTFTPKVSIGVFNILEFGLGYSVELKEKSGFLPLKGWNWSLGLSIPFNYHIR